MNPQVTYLNKVYRRYTAFNTDTVCYNGVTTDGVTRFMIQPTAVQTTVDDITLCGTHLDRVDFIRLQLVNNTNPEDTVHMNDYNNEALETLSKFTKKVYTAQCINLPRIDHQIHVLYGYDYHLTVDIHWNDAIASDDTVYCQVIYLCSDDTEEIRRLCSTTHAPFSRHCTFTESTLQAGANTVALDVHNLDCSVILIHTDCDAEVKAILHTENISHPEYIINKQSQYIYRLTYGTSHRAYVIDMGHNLRSQLSYQCAGSLALLDGAHLDIHVNRNCKVRVLHIQWYLILPSSKNL